MKKLIAFEKKLRSRAIFKKYLFLQLLFLLFICLFSSELFFNALKFPQAQSFNKK